MQDRFKSFITNKKLFLKNDKLLVAVSGGVDSVVLCHLLKALGYDFAIAHCNFNLRGKASAADEKFCRKLSEKLQVTCHVIQFDTERYSSEKKLSTQMAARELRYNWFAGLIKENDYSYLLTAHHAGDNTETVLINLLRGTGINGLKGIQPKHEYLVRPLLIFTKEEITAFANENTLKFREDQSNYEDKYLRNYLRLKVIPRLKKQRPDLDRVFLENSGRFTEESQIVTAFIEQQLIRLTRNQKDRVLIDRAALAKEQFKSTLLHHLLTPFGFTETQKKNIETNLNNKSVSGKKYFTESHELNIERTELVIYPKANVAMEKTELKNFSNLKRHFKISKANQPSKTSPDELLVDRNKLIFPLLIRQPITGDKFRPFGMKGFKLLSDFFRERKFSATQKRAIRLLVNGNGDIIWVMGYRSDDRYKAEENSEEIIKLKLLEGNT